MMIDTLTRLGAGDLEKGLHLWDQAGKKEQRRFIMEMFDQGQVACCRNAFFQAYISIDFADIFCHWDIQATKEWRKAFRMKFFGLLCSVVDNVIKLANEKPAAKTAGKKALDKFWRTHMDTEEMKSLNLGTVEDVPRVLRRNQNGVSLINRYSNASSFEVYTVQDSG